MNQVRTQVNKFKHVPHYNRLKPVVEHVEVGIAAFREVLALLLRTLAAKPNPGIDADG